MAHADTVNNIERRSSSVLGGAVLMIVISALLFFLPAINGFVGGLVGGYKVGSLGRAIMAALLPALVLAAFVWLVMAVFNLPVVGLLSGLALWVVLVLSSVSLVVGAAIGGAMAAKAH